MDDDSAAPGWTERNVHDPGITLLQVVAYSLGALAFVGIAAAAMTRRRRADTGQPD